MRKILFIFLLNIFYIGNIFSFYIGNEKINFSQSIIYQKKSVKIYGKTRANTKLLISIGKIQFKIKSNKKGSYSLKIDTLSSGKYRVVSKVFVNGIYYLVPREKEIVLGYKYVEKMKSYYEEKKVIYSISPLVLNKGVLKEFKKLEKPKSVINFFLLYILLGIMSLLMLFLVLRKNDLI